MWQCLLAINNIILCLETLLKYIIRHLYEICNIRVAVAPIGQNWEVKWNFLVVSCLLRIKCSHFVCLSCLSTRQLFYFVIISPQIFHSHDLQRNGQKSQRFPQYGSNVDLYSLAHYIDPVFRLVKKKFRRNTQLCVYRGVVLEGSNPKSPWSKSKRTFAMDISHYSQNTLGQNPHGLKYLWIKKIYESRQ